MHLSGAKPARPARPQTFLDCAACRGRGLRACASATASAIAVADVSLQRRRRRGHRRARPERRRQDHHDRDLRGLRTADAGSVRVLGLDPRRDAAALRTRVGVMPQGGSGASGVYPQRGPARCSRCSPRCTPIRCRSTRCWSGSASSQRRPDPWRRLSGGQQQRLSLALAVVGRPEVVVPRRADRRARRPGPARHLGAGPRAARRGRRGGAHARTRWTRPSSSPTRS